MPIKYTLSDIQAGLGNVVKSITYDNGYENDIQDKNVHLNIRDREPGLSGDSEVDLYPRVVIQLFGEEYDYGPSKQVYKSSIWYIGVSVLVMEEELDSLNDKVQSLITDMETAFMSDYQLGGKAISAQIVDNVYDQGYIDRGIAIVMFRVRVMYISHRGR